MNHQLSKNKKNHNDKREYHLYQGSSLLFLVLLKRHFNSQVGSVNADSSDSLAPLPFLPLPNPADMEVDKSLPPLGILGPSLATFVG